MDQILPERLPGRINPDHELQCFHELALFGVVVGELNIVWDELDEVKNFLADVVQAQVGQGKSGEVMNCGE